GVNVPPSGPTAEGRAMTDPLPEDPFPSTHWSALHAGEQEMALRARVCQAYRSALVAYLRGRRGLLPAGDEPEHVVDDFLHDKILTGSLLRRAAERYAQDPAVRFRRYLLRSLRNHLIDRRRQENREARPLPDEGGGPGDDAEAAFE